MGRKMSSFNEQGFEKKLLALKDSQESISSLSDWCLINRQHHKKIVGAWLHVLKRVKVENRLTLFYLANDVIQYSKRKNYDFVESWGTALQKATTMVRDEKVIHRILRIFKIWGERNVYDDAFLTDLRGLLTVKKTTPTTPVQAKKVETPAQPTPVVFEPPLLFLKINKCKELEEDTDLKLKVVNECKLKLNDLDAFRKSLKDRRHADGVAGELDEAILHMEQYKKALEVEVLERKAVIELLQQAEKFYETERGEAKIVFNAYRNFGSRVKSQKRKLDELIPSLASPIPSPDINAPSPSPDSDIDLPNDEDLSGQSVSDSKKDVTQNSELDDMPNCFTSFMGSGVLPFDIQSNLFSDEVNSSVRGSSAVADGEPEGKPIEVISRRKEEDSFDITNFLKNLAQGSPGVPKSNSSSAIPGLGDPLPVPPPSVPSEYRLAASPSPSPVSVPLPPPPMPPLFDSYSQDNREREDSWNTSLPAKFPTWRDTAESNWSREEPTAIEGDWMPALPVAKVPPPPIETPESPPSFEKESNSFREPIEYDDTGRNEDVDHRLFAANSSKDVDHRALNNRFKKDVDHRNLISLTGSPREVREALQPPPLPPMLWGDSDSDYRSIPMPRRQGQGGDIVESVDMEMSDEEDGDHPRDKVRQSEDASGKRSGSAASAKTESPSKERDESGKNKDSVLVKPPPQSAQQRYQHLPPGPPRLDVPPPRSGFPDPLFPQTRFDSPGIRPEFGSFHNSGRFPPPPGPPPAGIPLPSHPPGISLRVRHTLPLLPSLIPPPPSIPASLQIRSAVPPSSTQNAPPQRSLSTDTPPSQPVITTPPAQPTLPQPGTPSGNTGATNSGPEESDTESIGQYLNMGLSDDEDIKDIVASMDPQMLQEVVDNISIANPSDKGENSISLSNNGGLEDSESEWNTGLEMNNRITSTPTVVRQWKNSHGTPTVQSPLPVSPVIPGNVRFRGQSPNWRPPLMLDRGGFNRGRWGGFRPFRGVGHRGGPRHQFGGSW